jgi:aspartyl/glutamyl-tRNA(Asn/Gln) amidotransferase C subunit
MTEEQIRHLARLSEIELTDEDVENMKKEFNSLLDFV